MHKNSPHGVCMYKSDFSVGSEGLNREKQKDFWPLNWHWPTISYLLTLSVEYKPFIFKRKAIIPFGKEQQQKPNCGRLLSGFNRGCTMAELYVVPGTELPAARRDYLYVSCFQENTFKRFFFQITKKLNIPNKTKSLPYNCLLRSDGRHTNWWHEDFQS